jgi:hypothetical protein
MNGLSLGRRVQLIDARSLFIWIIASDAALTDALESESTLTSDDREAAIDLAGRLHTGIENAKSLAQAVCEIANSEGLPSLGQARDLLVENIGDTNWQTVEDLLIEHDESVASLACDGASTIESEVQGALDHVDHQIEDLQRGGGAEGDLPRRFMCGLAKVSMAAGLLTIWIPPHAQSAAAIGGGISVYKTLGCQDVEDRAG